MIQMKTRLQNELFHGALITMGLDVLDSMALDSYRSELDQNNKKIAQYEAEIAKIRSS